MCSFPFCNGNAAVLMQPTFDRGRTTWHDAQIRHTMDPPSKQNGRGALHRNDLDGRDHDRHHHGWRALCNEGYRTCQNTRRFPTAHLDPSSPRSRPCDFFAESVCRDTTVLDLRVSTTKRLMGSACLRTGGKTRASQRKRGATRTSISHSSMGHEEPAARTASIHQSHEMFFQARCRTEGEPASCRCCDDAPGSGRSPATTILAAVANFQTRALKTEVEFPSMSHACLRSLARALCCRGARCWVGRWD